MNDWKYAIKKDGKSGYYIYRISDNTRFSKNMESKGDLYKEMANLLYPPIKTAYITKKKITLFAV